MLISCPSCASQYTIAPDRVGTTGRVVRCAACREPWFIASTAAETGSVPTIALADRVGSSRSETRATEPRRSGRGGTASRSRTRSGPASGARGPGAAPLACIGLVALLAAGFGFRTDVVRLMPGSAGLFAAVGLPVNLVGLSLADVHSQLSQGATGRVLTVTAEIANATARPVAVPRLALSIGRENGESLYDWTASAPEPELAPGASMRFEARLPSPPPEGRVVLMTFSTAASPAKVASR